MSDDLAISVQHLSKVYAIAHNSTKHTTLHEALISRIRQPFQKRNEERFWALHDISLEIKKGSVVGIIGRNGAGKSTLLKILSRITEPSEGKVHLYGRVGSLLEVGTGFHPELTGRENIYLNGQILGMRRKEIDANFDAIVDFADVEKFLDTPVKRYSSGMYVRLAFAVAAYLNSEILLVDEVLAVGDAEFQKKCLGKMSDVAQSGRTVLFVSHNLAAIATLCGQVAVLNKGQLAIYGNTDEALALYGAVAQSQQSGTWERDTTKPAGPLVVQSVASSLRGKQPNYVMVLNIRLKSNGSHRPSYLAIDFLDSRGVGFMQAIPTLEGFITDDRRTHEVEVEIDLPPLVPGRYLLTIWAGPHNNDTLDEVKEIVAFEINQSPTPGRTYQHAPSKGLVVPFSRMTVANNNADVTGRGIVERPHGI
jgi:lipopolysaccharide transport system ATP-binding protein